MAKTLKSNKKKGVAAAQIIPTEIEFDYIKSNFFRVISMDGAFGGLNPGADGIHMAIYSERRALPTKTVQSVNADGTLGQELMEKRRSRNAIVRELEADLVLDLRAAINLQSWLAEKIAECAGAQGLTADQLKEWVQKSRDARRAARQGRAKSDA